MALFGGSRDISMFRHINRELMGNIITQQCAYYAFALDKTKVNIYGEVAHGKYYTEPVLLNALIKIGEQSNPITEQGVDFDWKIQFSFLLDDLTDAGVNPNTGDIILFQDAYFEVDNSNAAQFFVGKDPDYPYEVNPLNPGLSEFGYNVSVICETHYIPRDKVNLDIARL